MFNDKVGSWNVASVSNMGGVCPLLARRVRVRACGAAPPVWAGLALASALGRFGAWVSVSHLAVAVALASVPCGRWAMPHAVCSQMFYSAKAFNKNLGSWNVAKVTDMASVCPPTARRVHMSGRASGVGWPRLLLPRRSAASVLEPVHRTWLLCSHLCRAGFGRCGAWFARRRFTRQQISTRPSANGTWPRSRRCVMYAPYCPSRQRAGMWGRASGVGWPCSCLGAWPLRCLGRSVARGCFARIGAVRALGDASLDGAWFARRCLTPLGLRPRLTKISPIGTCAGSPARASLAYAPFCPSRERAGMWGRASGVGWPCSCLGAWPLRCLGWCDRTWPLRSHRCRAGFGRCGA